MAEMRLLFGPGLGMKLGHTLRVLHFARYCANSHVPHEAQHFMEEWGREGWLGGWWRGWGEGWTDPASVEGWTDPASGEGSNDADSGGGSKNGPGKQSWHWMSSLHIQWYLRWMCWHPTITFTEINGSGCIPQYLIRWFSIFCFSCLLLSAFWRQGFLKNNYISKYNTQYLTFDSLYSCTFLRFLGLWRLGSWFIGLLRFLALWVLGS